jgi:hypothetical protein
MAFPVSRLSLEHVNYSHLYKRKSSAPNGILETIVSGMSLTTCAL